MKTLITKSIRKNTAISIYNIPSFRHQSINKYCSISLYCIVCLIIWQSYEQAFIVSVYEHIGTH